MIRVVLEEPKKLSVEEAPIPTPGPSEVLIRVKVCGICGSDVSAYLGKHPFVKYPVVQGHEFSGKERRQSSRRTVSHMWQLLSL